MSRYQSVYVPGKQATEIGFGDVQEGGTLVTPPVGLSSFITQGVITWLLAGVQ